MLEKKDMEFHKQASEFRVQIIELREANVKEFYKLNLSIVILTQLFHVGQIREAEQ